MGAAACTKPIPLAQGHPVPTFPLKGKEFYRARVQEV